MRRFFGRLLLVLGLLLVFPGGVVVLNCHIDTFNVFHWRDVRFTSAEPNKNFIKTRHVLENPGKFNAFVFGSSRAGMLPPAFLPKTLGGDELRWYNMSYSEGVPAENLETLEVLVAHNVDVKMVLVSFDCMMMYLDDGAHRRQLMRMSYRQYERSKAAFLKSYLLGMPDLEIVSQVLRYRPEEHEESRRIFYEHGVNSVDMGLSAEFDEEKYAPFIFEHVMTDAWKSLVALRDFCAERNIRAVFFTSPIYESNYRYAVAHGYLEMLREIGGRCGFFNFSGLNRITTDPKYYFEGIHYRPAAGLLVEKVLFSTDEGERERIRAEAALCDADRELFGMEVDSSNVDEVVGRLREQLRDG